MTKPASPPPLTGVQAALATLRAAGVTDEQLRRRLRDHLLRALHSARGPRR